MRGNIAGAKIEKQQILMAQKVHKLVFVDQLVFGGWVEILMKKHGMKST